MSIKQLLDYQEADMQYIRLENEVRNSEVGQKLATSRSQQKQIVEELLRLNTQTEELFAGYQRVLNQAEETEKEIAELNASVSSDRDTADLEYYNKTLEKCMSVLDSADREAQRIQKELQAIRDTARTLYAKATKVAQLVKEYTDGFNKLRIEKGDQAKQIASQREALKKQIAPEWVEMYEKARKNGKAPFLVPMASGCCRGCGMEVDQTVKDKFSSGAMFVECPNCGRIIYAGDAK